MPKKKEKSSMYMLGVGLSLVTEMLVAAFLGWWVGTQLDVKFGTNPYFTMSLMSLGIIVSLVHMVRILKKLL